MKHWNQAVSPERFDRQKVALDPACPSEVLDYLTRNKYDGEPDHRKVLSAVAQNVNTPISCLKILSHHEYDGVRRNVATNPYCPLKLLEKLMEDESSEVSTNAKEAWKKRTVGNLERVAMLKDRLLGLEKEYEAKVKEILERLEVLIERGHE